MQNLKDISNPTTAIDMTLVLMAKEFTLNDTTPTNNNQRSSSNPCNMQIAQPGMNMEQDRHMLMVEDNVGNQFRPNSRIQNGYNVVKNVRNQNGNGNVTVARVESNGNGNNENQIRCYNCQAMDHYARNYTDFDFMAAAGAYDKIEEVTMNYTLKDNLQQGSTSGIQTDNALVYDSNGSAKVHHDTNCYDNGIFNMFTQEDQYTELLNPITEPHMIQQNNSNVISMQSSVEHNRGTIEQHPATVEETRFGIEIERLLRAVVSKDIMSIMQNPTVVDTSDLQTELESYKDMQQKIERLQAQLGDLKGKSEDTPCVSDTLDLLSSAGNNIKLVVRNDKSEVVCATCKQCLITANHDVYVSKYVNDMNSSKKNQHANVSEGANQKKHKQNVKKSKKLGSEERITSSRPSKPRTCLSQVKDNKIDLLVQQYEQFTILKEESIDSGFARFNTIITSLKALNESFSSKNYVRKFLRALHPKWRAKERVKSIALKAKKESSDDETSTSVSDDEEYDMAESVIRNALDAVIQIISLVIVQKPPRNKDQKAFIGGSWSDNKNDADDKANDETCLMA
ncbi:hypothetical protein Tco_0878481 [Tanacetum coccineum]|uniref:UBN2 domain-containing protein n=1 Tax=Tanacetum coccineum TaxID=301880 RepID=A0ABQ5BY60_9ASTR